MISERAREVLSWVGHGGLAVFAGVSLFLGVTVIQVGARPPGPLVHKPPVEWEALPKPGTYDLSRTRTPGGWLVYGPGADMVYVPDPDGAWLESSSRPTDLERTSGQ